MTFKVRTRMSTKTQLLILFSMAVLLGFMNNLREKTHIPWVQKWASLESITETKISTEKEIFTQDTIEIMLVENQGKGPTDISINQAKAVFDHASDLTLWIDARDEELFEKGHIPGSVLLDFYNQMDYLPEVEMLIEERQPVAIVVYCKGIDCHDSHLLAESLTQLDYDNIFVYKGGWAEWNDELGLPVEGSMAQNQNQTKAMDTTIIPPEKPEQKPKGMYLENIIRDLVPFLLGLAMVLTWKKTTKHEVNIMSGALICGVFFIWAAVPKIINPFSFAKSIWNYNLVPEWSINTLGLTLPWIEFLAGIGLALGMIRPEFRKHVVKGSSVAISALLLVFITAISINVLKGHEFNCGCTSDLIYFKDYYFQGWNDKYTLILRDIGLLAISIGCFISLKHFSEKSGKVRNPTN